MASKTNVFFTGATGYIGGTVLSRFLDRPDIASYNIRVLVRSPEKAEKIKAFGVEPVVGSHDDIELVEKLASETDIFYAIVNADHLLSAKAILAGLKKRYETTGKVPVLIHTSGAGLLADNAAGMHPYDKLYDDSNPDLIESLAPTQKHRDVDLTVVNADSQGYVRTYIVVPSTIYGIATGKLAEAGVQNTTSIQIPPTIRASLARGQAGFVGLGKNQWPNVHIDDIVDLYDILLDAILADPTGRKIGHGREGFYFGENGQHEFSQISKAIGDALVALGRSKSAEPTTFTQDEISKFFNGSNYLGSNARCVATRSRSIGWKPKHTTEDMLASIRPEVEYIIKKENL